MRELDVENIERSEPLILALDTSPKVTSLAVARGSHLLRSISVDGDEKRSEKLWLDIEALLEETGCGIGEIDLFGVCVGPGGFTGLRIGISAVKGLAAATRKPVAGVTSLEASAYRANRSTAICAMTNAYKNEVCSQLFIIDEEGAPVALNAPLVSTPAEALARVRDLDRLIFAGDGAFANAEIIKEIAGNKFKMVASEDERVAEWRIEAAEAIIAAAVAELAYLKFKRGMTDTPETLRACYVRPAEAQIKLSLGLLGTKIQRSMKAE